MSTLALTEVIAGDVGRPRGDGSPGSALYAVPIGLSRKPDPIERELLVAHWNRPPRFTTMHRPGILSVRSDRVVLDGTTIEEVERYHATTLKLVVDKVNADAAAYRERQQLEAERDARASQQHHDNVAEVANRISFED